MSAASGQSDGHEGSLGGSLRRRLQRVSGLEGAPKRQDHRHHAEFRVCYAMGYIDVGKDGSLVVEIPPEQQGILDDFW
jgi:hypothetical protein